MRATWAVLSTAILVPLAAVGVTSIASAAPTSRPDSSAAQTFTVLAHATNFKMINVDGKGIGPGVVERWALRHGGTAAHLPGG
jgi:hypothetical protein